MTLPEFIAIVVLGIIYLLVFLFLICITVKVNKKSAENDKKYDKSLNLMLICLDLVALCKYSLFIN